MNAVPANRVRFVRREWLLCAIIGVSAVLAWHRVADCRLWFDEFYSISIAQHSLRDIWSLSSRPAEFYFNSFPPLYETILHFVWDGQTAERVLAARAVSVVFHGVSLALLFFVGRELCGRAAGLTATFLAGINYAYLYYAKMIRGYSFLTMLCLASFLLFLIILKQDKPRRVQLVALTAVNTMLLYTSYLAGFLIFFQGVMFCRRVPRRGARYLIWLLLSVVLFAPWLPHFMHDLRFEPAFAGSAVFGLGVQQAATIWQRFSVKFFSHPLLAVMYLLSLLWFYLGRRVSAPGQRRDAAAILLGILFIIVVVNCLTARVGDLNRIRYSLPYAFPFFLVAGITIQSLRRPWGAVVFVLMSAVSLNVLSDWFRRPPHEFWRSDLAWAAAEAKRFPVGDSQTAVIEIEHYRFTPTVVYYFLGPRYFPIISFPRYASTRALDALHKHLAGKYRFCQNEAFDSSPPPLESIPRLANADWLFLIYTPWLENQWKRSFGMGFPALYQERIRQAGLGSALRFVARKVYPDAVLEVYRVGESGLRERGSGDDNAVTAGGGS